MQSTYFLIPIGTLAIFLYLFTLLLSKLSILKLTTHRKIWNILLLCTFIITAILGLILAIQVNYKLKIPFLKQLLTLHVDFGIGMAMIAIFHFLWHWNYYISLFKFKKTHEKYSEKITVNNLNINKIIIVKQIWLPAFLLGFTTLITQIVLLREFMIVFSGNELVIGMILAIWMILTGAGAYLGRFMKFEFRDTRMLTTSLVLLGIIPFISVFLINFLKNIVFEPGLSIGITKILYSVTILLIPFCLLSGFLFIYLATFFSVSAGRKKIDTAYAFESMGSIAGGVIFSFFIANYLNSFRILSILLAINMITAFYVVKYKHIIRYFIILLSMLLFVAPYLIKVDEFAKQFLFINQRLTYIKDTPYGNLAITNYGGQLNFFENNVLLFTTENVVANEEAVHYAMIQHNNPRDILLIAGGISGITSEIQKYNVESIDYVELNPWLFKIGKEFTSALNNQNIRIIRDDARIFIKKTKKKYDVIIINLPEPVTAQINRYYTFEFYEDIKKALNRDGIISFSLSSTVNYLSKEAIELNSTICKTIKKVFNYVLIFPGEKNYYIASDGHLTLSIANSFDAKKIENTYMNQYYLENESIIQRSDYIMSSLDKTAKINKDYFPVSYFKQINLWLSQFNIKTNILITTIIIFIIMLLSFIYRLQPANLGMFTAGFAASSLEFIILITFQVIYGYIYQVMGAFFAVFMTGLAIGTVARKKMFKTPDFKSLLIIQSLLIIVVILTMPCIALLKLLVLSKVLVYFICFILLFLIAFIVGMFFSLATFLQEGDPSIIAGKVYSADLIGSALGAFLTATIVIPNLGIYNTILIVTMFSLISLALMVLKKKMNNYSR